MADVYIKTVNGGEDTTPDVSDAIELDTGTTSTWTLLGNLLKIINGHTEDTNPDVAADYLITYDASAGTPKKVLITNAVSDAKITTTDVTTNNVSTSKHGFQPKLPGNILYRQEGLTGAWVQNIIRKTADESLQNNTLQNDDALVYAVAANEVYHFKLFLLYQAANTTMDMKLAWTLPAGATMQWAFVGASRGASLGSTGTDAPAGTAPDAVLTEATTALVSTAAATSAVTIEGVVVVSSTAGNVQLQWAQNTTNANNLTIKANSHIILTRLA